MLFPVHFTKSWLSLTSKPIFVKLSLVIPSRFMALSHFWKKIITLLCIINISYCLWRKGTWAEKRNQWYRISLDVYNSLNLGIFIELCSHHHNQFWKETSYLLAVSPTPFSTHIPLFLAATNLLSCSINLPSGYFM